MRYRRIPRTDIQVSEIGLPVSELLLSGPRRQEPADVQRLLHRAMDLGVTLFEVTDVPGEGESERLLAAAIGRRRPSLVIAARGGYDWYKPAHLRPEGRIEQDWSPAFIRKACEGSLLRLHTDYIDLYLLHYPGMRALESEELFDILATLRKEGKIREYGALLGPGTAWDEEGEMALKERKVVVVEAVYNVLQQKPGRHLFPLASRVQGGIIAADPLAAGTLERWPEAGTGGDPRLKELGFLVRNYDVTLAQAAVKFTLADAAVVSTLPKITREERLTELAAAADLPPMEPEDVQQLRDLYDAGFGVKGR